MNSFIDNLNQWGGDCLSFAWPMLWQCGLLILVVFAIDFLSRNQLRASVRYALWLVVLVKLCLPPTLALPTGASWWLLPHHATARPAPMPHYAVTYDNPTLSSDFVPSNIPALIPPSPKLDAAGWTLLGCGLVSVGLLLWLAFRWWQVSRKISRATPAEGVTKLLEEIRQRVGSRSSLQLKLVDGRMSPAVCGLFRPVILLPRVLAEQLSGQQLLAVLLHEAFHLRRKDVWVNCAQTLVQIVYWWHPLVWLANARIRRVREEAVDDAVMLALRDEGDSYAPTLLEVAKLAFNRPLMSLGLVGIMESRNALRKRIERLVNFRAPRKAGLTFLSVCGIFAFSAVALPMGEAPGPPEKSNAMDAAEVAQQSLTLKVNPEVFIQNVKAQATQSLLSPTNDYTVILLELLRTEGVDCAPPNGIAFDTRTAQITTQNTPDKLEIFRQVIEQLNRTDGPSELPLSNNPLRKRIVVIEARIYQMPSADFDNFTSGLQYYHGSSGSEDWWSASPEQFGRLIGELDASGLQLIQRPRIQTTSGITAELFVGNGTNNVEFGCKPYVADGFVDLTLRGTVARVAPQSASFTNYFSTKASAENHGGIVVRVKNYGGNPNNNLVTAIGVEMVTNTAHFQQRLQAIFSRRSSPSPASNIGGQSQLAPDTARPAISTGFVERARMTIGPRNSTHTVALAAPWEVNPLEAGGTGSSLESTSKVEQLFTRTIAINAHALTDLARDVPGLQTNDIVAIARSLFSKLGVDWDSPNGKTIFYTERLGWLYVRATKSDLDTIQRAIPQLNLLPPQIHIKARFIELTRAAVDDIYLGSINVNVATMPLVNTEGGLTIQHMRADLFAGIMTGSQFQTALQTINRNPGFEELAEPEVTTTSGRQTEMRATELITIITNFALCETPTNSVVAIVPQTNAVETGPTVNVIPYALADGNTIDLTVIASLTEFLGYDQPTNTAVAYTSKGQKINMPTISPAFAIREASANVKLWDGQTVVLGGMGGMKARFYDGGKWVNTEPDFFKRANAARGQPGAQDKELLVFVTVDLIDAAGNRIHSEDELSFAKNSVPPQAGP
jgi:beta-lactamase regulating signal transducer with metallopeptidase domain